MKWMSAIIYGLQQLINPYCLVDNKRNACIGIREDKEENILCSC